MEHPVDRSVEITYAAKIQYKQNTGLHLKFINCAVHVHMYIITATITRYKKKLYLISCLDLFLQFEIKQQNSIKKIIAFKQD